MIARGRNTILALLLLFLPFFQGMILAQTHAKEDRALLQRVVAPVHTPALFEKNGKQIKVRLKAEEGAPPHHVTCCRKALVFLRHNGVSVTPAIKPPQKHTVWSRGSFS